MKFILPLLSVICFINSSLLAQNVTIENSKLKLVVALKGAKFTELSLKSVGLNPIHTYGHFLCFDRWGPSSTEDANRGIPFHGEAGNTTFSLIKSPADNGSHIYIEMSGTLPIVKLSLNRKLYLDKNEPFFKVVETITNNNSTKSVFNLVQHVTIGGAFLDQTTIVDTKVDKGFLQNGTIPPTGDAIKTWPKVVINNKDVDLRYFISGINPADMVISYTLLKDSTYAWVTAANKSKKILIGYIWPVTDYPWLNLWAKIADNARGLEFGTSGLHQPFPAILSTGTILNQNLCEYVSPGKPITKIYYGFSVDIPTDYKGTEVVTLQDNKLTIKEAGTNGREIIIQLSMPIVSADKRNKDANATNFKSSSNEIISKNGNNLKINYKLESSEKVSITIYSLAGSKIKTILDAMQSAGEYSMMHEFDKSGSYICQIKAGSKITSSEIINVIR
jgi:hypothetical protein